MIIVRISGGLGNQLFQYSTAYSLSLETKQKLYLDNTWYQDIQNIENKNDENATTIREYLLDNYKISTPTISQFSLNWMKRLEIRSRKSSLFKYLKDGPLKQLSYSKFDSSNFSIEKLESIRNNYLTGYWQNNKLIEKYKNNIKTELKLKVPISDSLEKYLKEIELSDSVAIHFRKGDYLSKPNSSKIHANCSNQYYFNAIKNINKKIPESRFFIFSDEIDWVKSNIDLPENVTFIENIGEPFEHLFLMSSCKHQITANSTFSWWSAWLNEYPDKIIITPKQWYYDPKLNDSVIRIPDEWIKINNLD